MLSQVMLVQKLLLHSFSIGIELHCVVVHKRGLFKHHRIMHCVECICVPCEWAVVMYQHTGYVERVKIAEGLNYDLSGVLLVFLGGSAGGNLAAMLCMNVPNGAFPGEENRTDFIDSPTVQAAVDQFGPVRFETMTAQAKANKLSMVAPNPAMMPESKYLGVALDKAPESLLVSAYPGTYASAAMVPLLVQHGTADHLVPWAQSEEFVADLIAKGCGDRVEYIPLPGADHEDKRFFQEENMNFVFAFLEKHL